MAKKVEKVPVIEEDFLPGTGTGYKVGDQIPSVAGGQTYVVESTDTQVEAVTFELESDEPEERTRVHVLRPTLEGGATRYVEAKSRVAAMLYVAGQLYTCEVATPKDLRQAWKSGAQMETATT